MTETVALNLFASACNIAGAVFIILAAMNVRKATRINKEWTERLRAASGTPTDRRKLNED